MTDYYLRLRALSPLSITSHQTLSGQPSATLDFIPGTTLRGALAWHILRQRPHAAQEADFQALFDVPALTCDPLYPLDSDRELTSDLSWPVPVTARTCKRHRGFRSEPDWQRRGHGVVDTLIAALEETAAARLRTTGDLVPKDLHGLARHEYCQIPDCPAALDRLTGFYQVRGSAGQRQHRLVRRRLSLTTRTALYDELETALAGSLFSREVIDPDQEFAGFLHIQPSGIPDLEAPVASGDEILLGAGRTAGLGRMLVIELAADNSRLSRALGSVHDRYQAFKAILPKSLQERWALVPVTLRTDAILLDLQLRVHNALTPDVLCSYAQMEAVADPPPWPPDTELFLAATRTRRIASWNTAAISRPRSDDLAVAAGSVFVLAAAPDHEQELLAAAAWLEGHGIGERQAEGFGQLVVAHPFHAEVTPL